MNIIFISSLYLIALIVMIIFLWLSTIKEYNSLINFIGIIVVGQEGISYVF
jgi:hypothetical protein